MLIIKVGYIVPFMILKALPDYESYFCNLVGTDLYSLLPKKYSKKHYKIGDTDWAAIFEIKPPRIIISQKSPQYIRKTIESRFFHILAHNHLRIKRVASVGSANFFKVAVQCNSNDGVLNGKDIYELFKPYQDTMQRYIESKVYFVKYSPVRKEFAVNALVPAPIDRVKRVIFYEDMNTVEVIVDNQDVGIFLGKHKTNILSAKKLTGINIEIIGR